MGTKKLKEATLLSSVGSTSNGTWVDVTAWSRISVDIFGTFAATCKIMGSCEPTKPADATDGRQIGSDITVPTLYEITAKIKWLKVKVSAYTSGSISSVAAGDETKYGF